MLKLIHIKKIDSILKKILEPNYVLQSSVAQNRILKKYKVNSKRKENLGMTWHTDSRYLNNKRISKGFSYLVLIALDKFVKKSGATYFIEDSINFVEQPKRILTKQDLRKYKLKSIEMTEGSVCIMDTAMWHKAGESSINSRWSIFSIYTGWFVKPYFDYSKIFKFNIEKKYKKLLHFNSMPPKIDETRPVVTK